MNDRGFDVEPRYSPDGRWIVFNRLRLPDFDLAVFIVSTKGRASRPAPDPVGDQLRAPHLVT